MRVLIFLSDLLAFLRQIIRAKMQYSKLYKQDMEFLANISSNNNCFIEHLKTLEPDSRILVVELNSFHLETLEALSYYFNKLGFKMDLLLQEGYEGNLEAFKLKLEDILAALRSEEIKKYKFIFFNTMVLALREQHSIHGFITHNKIFGIYHTISDIERFKDYRERYFALRDIAYKNITLKGLNLSKPPCEIEAREAKYKEITFLSIGFPIYHRGFRERLKSLLKYLESKNINNARFIIIGKDMFKLEHKYITFIKSPSNKRLDEILRKVHFIFGIYDSFAHRYYLRLCTSGQRQLSLGYNLPLVINEPFASAFGFSKENAVIFNKNSDILEALSLKNYDLLKQNLSRLDRDLREQSLKNLKEKLEE